MFLSLFSLRSAPKVPLEPHTGGTLVQRRAETEPRSEAEVLGWGGGAALTALESRSVGGGWGQRAQPKQREERKITVRTAAGAGNRHGAPAAARCPHPEHSRALQHCFHPVSPPHLLPPPFSCRTNSTGRISTWGRHRAEGSTLSPQHRRGRPHPVAARCIWPLIPSIHGDYSVI